MFSIKGIAAFVTSWGFVNFAIPLITVLGGLFIKIVSRKDEELKLKREDWAIGFDLAFGAMIVFIAKVVHAGREFLTVTDPQLQADYQNQIVALPWMLIIWILGLWGISTVMRKSGWEASNTPEKTLQPKILQGIIIPIVFGCASLLFAVISTGGER